MKSWEVWECDLGHGVHPVVIISHPARVTNKLVVEVLDCTSQRASRPPDRHEVLLDVEDGLNWPTLCKCDCIYAVEKPELKNFRGSVTIERRRAVVRTIIDSHAWNAL